MSTEQQQQYICRSCRKPLTDDNWVKSDRIPKPDKRVGKSYPNKICRSCKSIKNAEKKARKRGLVLQEPELISNTVNRTPTVIEDQTKQSLAMGPTDLKRFLQSMIETADKAEQLETMQKNEEINDFNRVKNRQKIDEFKNYLEELNTGDYNKDWEILKAVFEENGIDTLERAFEIAEIALAWKEYFGWKGALTDLKQRVKAWIKTAREHGSGINFYRVNARIYKWYISREEKDFENRDQYLEYAQNNMKTARRMNQLSKERVEDEKQTEKQAVDEYEQRRALLQLVINQNGQQTTQSDPEVKEKAETEAKESIEENEKENKEQGGENE